MEEIIEDFKQKNITPKTIERQERILSKMLDSQKSLTQKDYSKKRKSKTSSDFDISSINEMPSNYGERDLFYINAMEAALDKGLPKEYQKITRIYFLNLQEETLNEIKQ